MSGSRPTRKRAQKLVEPDSETESDSESPAPEQDKSDVKASKQATDAVDDSNNR